VIWAGGGSDAIGTKIFPASALTVIDTEAEGILVGDKVATGVEITLVAKGTTEEMPEDPSCVITEPLVEGKTEEPTRETDISDDAIWIEDVVKTTIGELAEPVLVAAPAEVEELDPSAKRAPDGLSFADEKNEDEDSGVEDDDDSEMVG